MNNQSLELFTNPQLLARIGHRLLGQLFDRFAQLNWHLPKPCPDNETYFNVLAEILASPENLPPPMLGALLEIETLSGYDVQPSQIPPATEPESGPLCESIQDWLSSNLPPPTGPGPTPAPTADVPDTSPTRIEHQNVNGEDSVASPSETQNSKIENPRALHPPVPGDLAAIAGFPRNKISHLPPEVRESINQMLRQRIPYREILARLGEHGQALNKSNLSRWKKTGYLIWLQEQLKREDARTQLQLLLDVVHENDNGAIHEAAQQLATLKICHALADIDLSALKQSFQQDPVVLVRLVQAIPKLSQGGMTCEKLRLESAERKIKAEKERNPAKRGLSPETRKALEKELNLM